MAMKDPVCGMKIEEENICADYKEKKFCFCSEACKTTFEENPEKYSKNKNK